MASRGHIPPAAERRVVQASGMLRHGPLPTGHRLLDQIPPPDLLENKIAAQAAEMEQLASDNHKLASTHVALRQELVAAKEEVQRIKAHIRSIQTESGIEVRVLVDKIGKMEADIRAGENVKNDLKEAHKEAQSLVKAKQELAAQIQHASQELHKVHADVRSLPDLLAELDHLRHEHKRLRATFEYEKGLNIEKVEQLKAMEHNLIGMAREVERLRGEVLNVEKRASVPTSYGGGYMSSDPSYSTHVHGGATYVDAYGRPLAHMGVGRAGDRINSYAGNGTPVTATAVGVVGGMAVSNAGGAAGGIAISNAGGAAVWGGPYDQSLAPR